MRCRTHLGNPRPYSDVQSGLECKMSSIRRFQIGRGFQKAPLRRPSTEPTGKLKRCKVSALQYEVKIADNSAELRSIASFRAAIFFDSSSTTCSELARQSYLRSKAASTWDYLEEVTAMQTSGKKGSTICFYASTEENLDDLSVASIVRGMDPSCKLPMTSRSGEPTHRIVIGSLDFTIGPRLGGESLAGKEPPGQAALKGRAYLCNVSVAPEARRQGVAEAMIKAAKQHATQSGISDLYVHAAADNEGAIRLYSRRCSFELEQTEAADVARSLNRPKRLLFRKRILFVAPHARPRLSKCLASAS